MDSQQRLRRTGLGAFAVVFTAYFLKYTAGGLKSWFSNDDIMNMYYYWARPWTDLFKANIFFFLGMPRPMGGLYYGVIHGIFGFSPLPYRVGAMLLVLANLLLLFLVVRELAGIETGLLALLLTGLNQSFVSIYYDTGMIYDVLAFFFYYGAFYFYLRIRNAGLVPNLRQTILILLLYIAALNSKEIAVSLPVALLLYELLYLPSNKGGIQDGKAWLWGPARVPLLSIAITGLFVAGLRFSPVSLMNLDSYHPHPSLALYLERSAWYLRMLSIDVFRPQPSGMQGIYIGIFVLALLLRKRQLVFAAILIMVAILPLAFIPPRSGFGFYVPSLYWSLWAAGTLVALRELMTEYVVAVAPQFGGPLRVGCQLVLLATLAASAARRNDWGFGFVLPIVHREQERNRLCDVEIHRSLPQIPKGSRILVLNDPWPTLGFEAAFLLQLSYNDPTIQAVSLQVLQEQHRDPDRSKFDFVLDFVDGHFRLVGTPAAAPSPTRAQTTGSPTPGD